MPQMGHTVVDQAPPTPNALWITAAWTLEREPPDQSLLTFCPMAIRRNPLGNGRHSLQVIWRIPPTLPYPEYSSVYLCELYDAQVLSGRT